jgi:hypothetical protein
LRVGFDLAADAADQHVDAALERTGMAALGEVEQAVARQHAAGALAKGAQQVEFGAGHRDARARGIAQLPQPQIDPPALEDERGRPAGGAGGLRRRLPAQHRVDPGQQLPGIERFWQIIVGAHFEAYDAVDVLAARREHDDRRLRIRADLSAQAQPILAGQHDIEDEEIDAPVGHCTDHLAAVGCGGDVAGIGAQVFGDQRPRLAVVFHDKDVGRRLGHKTLVGDSAGPAKDFCFQMFLTPHLQHGATGRPGAEKVSLRPSTLPSR